MNSCLYRGVIRHRRKTPTAHRFNFYAYMLLLDLSEIETVFANRWLWSTGRPALAWFRRDDHLKAFGSCDQLRQRVRLQLDALGFDQTIGTVKLLTQLRHFGFEMNPVSFYYCYDVTGDRVIAVLAEVNNTPWGEQHVYLIRASDRDLANDRVSSDRVDKSFHVSPFMDLDMHYRMVFTYPQQQLTVKMENWQQQQRIFNVSMLLQRKPITTKNLALLLIRYPLLSFQTFIGIYWQALRLYLKRVPVYPHPKKQGTAT